jgi:alkylhydroperoxidase family enzyme
MGEREQRLDALNAWPEAPFYTDRERAALAWTEAVTWVADGDTCRMRCMRACVSTSASRHP